MNLNSYQKTNYSQSVNGEWSSDIENVLEQIRINSVIMSKEHKTKFLNLKGTLRYFRVPVILISSIASVSSVGLQPYIDQQLISVITCLLSLTCGIIGSIELFLAIQSRMENELMASKDYYILSIEIFKVLTLDRENRSTDGKAFLETSYGTYVKLIENSNIIDKKIADMLAFVDKKKGNKANISEDIIKSSLNENTISKSNLGNSSDENSSDENSPRKRNFFNMFYKEKKNILPSSSIDEMVGISLKKKNIKVNSEDLYDSINTKENDIFYNNELVIQNNNFNKQNTLAIYKGVENNLLENNLLENDLLGISSNNLLE